MDAPVTQIAEITYPSNDTKPILRLRQGHRELGQRAGLRFTHGYGSAGTIEYVHIRIPGGLELSLEDHLNDRGAGLVVVADAGTDTFTAQQSFLAAIGLGAADVTWWRDTTPSYTDFAALHRMINIEDFGNVEGLHAAGDFWPWVRETLGAFVPAVALHWDNRDAVASALGERGVAVARRCIVRLMRAAARGACVIGEINETTFCAVLPSQADVAVLAQALAAACAVPLETHRSGVTVRCHSASLRIDATDPEGVATLLAAALGAPDPARAPGAAAVHV